jgi:hypothetical protein
LLARYLGNAFGENILPEASIAVDNTQLPPIYYSIAKGVNLISLSVNLITRANLPHMTRDFVSMGSGWGAGAKIYEANIGNSICATHVYNENRSKFEYHNGACVNNEKGGLINLLFQDSDIHIDNEHYIFKDDAFHYARIDVDHADFVFIPIKDDIRNLKDALITYGFSCKSLDILQELLDQQEIFRKSIQDSLEIVAQLFTDERIKQIYLGKEGFKYFKTDTSSYYHPVNISGNEGLGKTILYNFDSIFDLAQYNLYDIINDHSFILLGEVCNPNIEL